MINSLIHVLLYSYYALAALGPHVAKYLWWKKYLTILQLVSAQPCAPTSTSQGQGYTCPFFVQIQFSVALLLGVNSIRSGCDFPMWMQYALVVYMVSFIVLFGNFYAQAYIKKVSLMFVAGAKR